MFPNLPFLLQSMAWPLALLLAWVLGERLRKRGFAVEYIRAEGAPGDKDSHPRINVVARYEGESGGETVHFNGHIDVVEPGPGWTHDPFGAEIDPLNHKKVGERSIVLHRAARLEDLEACPGIGPAAARRIHEHFHPGAVAPRGRKG